MLTVHHLEGSRSIRIVWLLEELGADYGLEHYERNPETRLAPPALREVHPLGRSPVVTDGDDTIAESGAIIEYLLDHFGGGTLRPEDAPDARRHYRYWMHYAEGTAMPDLVMRIVFNELPEQAPWPVSSLIGLVGDAIDAEYIQPRIERHLDFWEEALADRDYFTSDAFSAADIQMSVPVGMALAGPSNNAYRRSRRWFERIRRRSAFEAACERIGELSPLVPDT